MMGPQWLCDCNKSGEAATLDIAAAEASQHFLGNLTDGEPHGSVAVYRKRGEWAYTISTVQKAQEVANPLRYVPPLPPGATLMQAPVGAGTYLVNDGRSLYTFEASAMSFKEAQQRLMEAFESSMRRMNVAQGSFTVSNSVLEAGK